MSDSCQDCKHCLCFLSNKINLEQLTIWFNYRNAQSVAQLGGKGAKPSLDFVTYRIFIIKLLFRNQKNEHIRLKQDHVGEICAPMKENKVGQM